MDSNIQVKPGDILLLRSRGVHDRGSLLQQAVARRGRDRFTRVAVVVNDELIADAMPHQGVQLRRWRDIQDRYDLAASRVARHDRLATEPDAETLVFQRASHFYRQRYDVKSVMRTDDGLGPDGELCSQFLGALYGDLGLRCGQASGPAAWSHDIDAHTRHGLWHQYPLGQLSLQQEPALPPMARWTSLPGEVPGSLLHNLQQRRAHSEYERLLDSVEHSAAVALRLLPQLAAPQPWDGPAAGLALGGDSLLASWQRLFMAGSAMLSGRQRLERQYAAFAARVLDSAHQLREALHGYSELQRRCNGAATPELGPLAAQLLAWGDALVEDEVTEEVLLRLQNYPVLHADLMELDDGQDEEAIALGVNALVALSEIDLLRLDWVGGQRASLRKPI